ncbi:MAG: T9SS type A sorting domain-containing protein [Flammeovirgaceae bacterium]|nr:T9SS type A sorting domain-containing protein [Flammeovirgaceae bacterium]
MIKTKRYHRIRKLGTIAFLFLFSTTLNAQCWQAVSAGIDHTIAIKPDGTLWGWGFNGAGQLGDGTTIEKSVPVKIGNDSNWKIISAGGNSSLAIKKDGTLWAWGDNFWGQLGDGSFGNKRFIPVRIGTDNNWESVSEGRAFTLAIKTDGTLWAWGNNLFGQLGNQASAAFVPTRVGTSSDWKAVSAGGNHTIAIKVDGSLWAWGYNYNGQLGNGTSTDRITPNKIGTDTNWQSIAVGNSFSIGIRTDGTLWAWGSNDLGQLGNGSFDNKNVPTRVGLGADWKTISAGYNNFVATKTNGSLWACGWIIGKFGFGAANTNTIPTQIGLDTNWQLNSSGEKHSFAFKTDGTLWAWGEGTWGKIGDGTWNDYYEPQSLSLPPTGEIIQQFCTSATVGNLKANGTNVRWYSSPFGGMPLSMNTIVLSGSRYYASQFVNSCESISRFEITALINNTQTPPPTGASVQALCANDKVSGLEALGKNIKWYSLSTGGAPLSNNTPVFDGNRYYASQTDNSCESTTRLDVLVSINTIPQPTGSSVQDFCDGSKVKDIVINGTSVKWFTLAKGGMELMPDTKLVNGSIYYATSNVGFLESCVRLPVKVRLSVIPTGEAIQTFCSSADITKLLVEGLNVKWYDAPAGGTSLPSSYTLKDGDIYYASQTVNGCESTSRLKVSVSIKTTPTVENPLNKEWRISVTTLSTTFAIKADGTLWAWGENFYGQLGTGSNGGSGQVGTDTNWSFVSNGAFFRTFGLKSNGTLWAWGDNHLGQLGDGTRINRNAPVQIGSDNDWQSISTDKHNCYAVKTDGTLWEWGESDEDRPIRWGNASDWQSVSAGHYRFFAIKKDGTLWAWGNNTYGELGSGIRESIFSDLPKQIGTDNNWRKIALGTYHTLAIKADGTLWAWGFNIRGELGDGTTNNKLSPVQIGTDKDWMNISAGQYFSLAIKENGTLWAWGINGEFQHGDFTTRAKRVPTKVGSDTNWLHIFSYENRTTATKSDGTLWSWGEYFGASAFVGNSQMFIPACYPIQVSFCETTPVVANLSSIGSALKWYRSSYGGIPLSSSEILANNSDYFAAQIIDGCESQSRLRISTSINEGVVSAPTGSSNQVFCMAGSISDLQVIGQGIKWYNSQTGGIPLPAPSALINSTRYFASQTINTCESKYRFEVLVSINESPPVAPIGEVAQNLCPSSKIENLVANGSAIKWYTSATGGSPLAPTNALTNGTRYYASQTVNACESQTRLEVLVTLNSTTLPSGSTSQTFCAGATVANLLATGTNIKWYASLTAIASLASTATLTNGTRYYATQTLNNCESHTRLEVLVTLNSSLPPTGASSQTFCSGATVANLVASGNNIKWYAAATGGTTLVSTMALTNGVRYYASQTLNSCESVVRLEVLANVTTASAPVGASTQTFCQGATIGNLVATGNAIKWYSTSTSGTPLPSSTLLVNNIQYFASQTVVGCESSARLSITAIVNPIPPAPSGASSQIVETGKTITALAAVGASIKWYATEMDAINTRNTLALSTQVLSGSSYYATQTVLGCESVSFLKVTASLITGIEINDPLLEFYPNPVTDILSVTYHAGIDEVTVANLIGQIVVSKKVNGKETSVDFSDLGSGIYLIRLHSRDNLVHFKIMKSP